MCLLPKIIALAILGIAAVMIPAGYVPAPINHYVESPVSEGL